MEVLGFLLFLVVSHWGAMYLFGFTTYHAYFWIAVPFLILYGGVVGWALFSFGLHQFFLWLVVCEIIWLYSVARKQSRTASAIASMHMNDPEKLFQIMQSADKTRKYYALSAFVYVAMFSVSYMVFFNN